jgi:predicted RNA-binding Zn-ribbon protein involved in translation (DUF1610 family)
MKSPRFFCENCGAEVERNTAACPRCGRFFASVRCPSCGFTGAEGLFSGGCPVCGYSAPGALRGMPDIPKKNNRTAAGKLPLWTYIISVFALLVVLTALYFVIK